MSRLPYQEIKERCSDENKPLIFPCYEKTQHLGLSFGLSESGYDIRIAQDITLYPRNLQTLVNNYFFEKQQQKKWYMRVFNLFKVLEPRKSFALASSIEQFNVSDDLMPDVKDKSTWARKGLVVQNTVIEPGWAGYLTLELANHSENVIEIRKGTPIAQIVFETLTKPTTIPYKGKYQNQDNRPVEAITDENYIRSMYGSFDNKFNR